MRSSVFDIFKGNHLFIALFQFIIMVIDSTDRERLAVTREELYTLLQHEDLSKACLLVYANKQVSACSKFYFVARDSHCKFYSWIDTLFVVFFFGLFPLPLEIQRT